MVEVLDVDTHSPLAIALLDHDNVKESIWVLYFPNEPCNHKFVDLLSSTLIAFGSERPAFLSDWPGVQHYIESMRNYVHANAFHVCMRLGKAVLASREEFNQSGLKLSL